jgi:hypothetical protein
MYSLVIQGQRSATALDPEHHRRSERYGGTKGHVRAEKTLLWLLIAFSGVTRPVS